MFKNWTVQQWIGKLLLFAIALGELVVKQLGVNIPWWTIIVPAATGGAQWLLNWLPGEVWQGVVGKGLLMAITLVEVVLAGLGLKVPLWAVLMPAATAIAQYLISQVPTPPAPATEAPAA